MEIPQPRQPIRQPPPEKHPTTPKEAFRNFVNNRRVALHNTFSGLSMIGGTSFFLNSLAKGDVKSAVMYGLMTFVIFSGNVAKISMMEDKLHEQQEVIRDLTTRTQSK
jgi:hypothetical protein